MQPLKYRSIKFDEYRELASATNFATLGCDPVREVPCSRQTVENALSHLNFALLIQHFKALPRNNVINSYNAPLTKTAAFSARQRNHFERGIE
jgi:hypothetical protein